MLNFPGSPVAADRFGDYTYDGSRWILTSNPVLGAGFRNAFINPDFLIAHRFQPAASAAGTNWIMDRWNASSVGTTYKQGIADLQKYIKDDATAPAEMQGRGNSYLRMAMVTPGAGVADYCLLRQPIEDVRTFAGRKCTLSFWARSPATVRQISVDLYQHFGTGGSPSAPVTFFLQKFSLSTAWVKYTFPVDVPSVVGKTEGTNPDSHIMLRIWLDAGSNYNADSGSLGHQLAGDIDFAQIQFEAGANATPFERRSYGQELRFCQRYWQQNYLDGQDYYFYFDSPSTGGFGHSFQVMFQERMRIAPSVSTSYSYGTNLASNTVYGITSRGFAQQVVSTNPGGCALYTRYTANAELV